MVLRKIAQIGHPVLRARAAAVEDPEAEAIQTLRAHMTATLKDAHGLGLAAPQIYESLRVILFLPVEEREEIGSVQPVFLLNPEIEALDEVPVSDWEGCLSIPELRGRVPRYRRIGYKGLDANGNTVEREAEGLHARVVQHEVDHLNGVLFLERMDGFASLSTAAQTHLFEEETPRVSA